MPTNPTSVPSLDVEACVRLLKEVARDYERQAEADEARGYEPFQRTTDIAAMLRALASALPGMGKDSSDMDWLEQTAARNALYAENYRAVRITFDAAEGLRATIAAIRERDEALSAHNAAKRAEATHG